MKANKTKEEIIEYCQYQMTILNVEHRFNELTEEEEVINKAKYGTYQNLIEFINDEN